jgi:hypothetical protein
MSNSQASAFAETSRFGADSRMHVTFTRTRSPARGHHAARSITIADTRMRVRQGAIVARGVTAKTFDLESFVGPFGPSCLFGGGFWPAAGLVRFSPTRSGLLRL